MQYDFPLLCKKWLIFCGLKPTNCITERNHLFIFILYYSSTSDCKYILASEKTKKQKMLKTHVQGKKERNGVNKIDCFFFSDAISFFVHIVWCGLVFTIDSPDDLLTPQTTFVRVMRARLFSKPKTIYWIEKLSFILYLSLFCLVWVLA